MRFAELRGSATLPHVHAGLQPDHAWLSNAGAEFNLLTAIGRERGNEPGDGL